VLILFTHENFVAMIFKLGRLEPALLDEDVNSGGGEDNDGYHDDQERQRVSLER